MLQAGPSSSSFIMVSISFLSVSGTEISRMSACFRVTAPPVRTEQERIFLFFGGQSFIESVGQSRMWRYIVLPAWVAA